MGNFTNICYSLALRHQLHQCYLSVNTETLSGDATEIGPGKIHSVQTNMSLCVHLTVGKSTNCSLPLWRSTTVPPTSFYRYEVICLTTH